jgi:hypothetical protein
VLVFGQGICTAMKQLLCATFKKVKSSLSQKATRFTLTQVVGGLETKKDKLPELGH